MENEQNVLRQLIENKREVMSKHESAHRIFTELWRMAMASGNPNKKYLSFCKISAVREYNRALEAKAELISIEKLLKDS